MRAAARGRGSADCSTASHRRPASGRSGRPCGSARPGRGPTNRRSAGASCSRGAHARSNRPPRRVRSSCTCSGTTRRSRRRCRAIAPAGCRPHARDRNRRSRRPRGRAARSPSGRTLAPCGTARRATRSRPGAGRVRRSRVRSRPSRTCRRLRRAASSIRSVAGSKPWKRTCDSSAWRSDGNAPASIRIAGRSCVGPIEAHQHQMQVRRQRVHRDDFRRLRADHAGERVAHEAVVGHPRRGFEEVAFDGFALPLVEHFLDHRARALRLQAERVAAEVRLRRAVVGGDVEVVAEIAERVGGVERADAVDVEQVVSHGCECFRRSGNARRAAPAIPARCRGRGGPVRFRDRSSAAMPAPGSCSPSGKG